MDEAQEFLGNNRLDDVHWLCTLSESELDMLISLKMLVIQRAKVLGYEDLAMKFDLKVLRTLAFVLMEYLKGNVKNFSHIPGMVKTPNLLDGCNLSQFKLGAILSIEELKACIGVDETKRRAKRPREEDTITHEK
ncbi:uncharacterized protein LOC110606348 [Manihot esculenta]|uniref:Uncharacterized protein n=2 Tax=Manihot esculenta TaxID=3983 RepID=A0A251LY81_MANES|nr:uncharacterized protein LOC110606348 [Manihot esculenta]XP_021600815.1 uncharacterized protein LOC110606348 [Manihot esculenta]KAG8660881.1 hypothetical protein MANES_02G204000v8 [Manihot esculenta]OAY58749.1 hypothetical protein MANES_02G204000v8 [Manihot esculenta]OAY58750.1 hypothetical protein MANES_02G204000v8 [Manihot esculenta]